MATYYVVAEKAPFSNESGTLLRLSFGEPANNDRIVVDAVAAIQALRESGQLTGGRTVFLNGAASLPAACAIGHAVCHLFTEVAVYDPKLGAYVVAISHGGRAVGTLIKG